MIGLSLSFCVQDMLANKVSMEEVICIVCGTHARDERQWAGVLEEYGKLYWRADPVRGKAIANALRQQGKIIQPRLCGDQAPNIASGHWAKVVQV